MQALLVMMKFNNIRKLLLKITMKGLNNILAPTFLRLSERERGSEVIVATQNLVVLVLRYHGGMRYQQ